MPVNIAAKALFDGIDSVPYLLPALQTLPWLVFLLAAKLYFSGASNLSERKLNGKVVLVTGGTSGVGEAVVRSLAARGAQIVLLTQHSLSDPFIVEYIDDVRTETNNHLITAEQVDLASLHSIRTFATKWIDNAPPRRLDMVVLCANTMTTNKRKVQSTSEGVELNWQVNYLANFHLLSILSPAIRAQPPDRDVRILIGSCSSYMGGDLLHIAQDSPTPKKKASKPTATAPLPAPTKYSSGNAYATSKFALVTFALAFQKHLSSYKRPDDLPMNAKVMLVDPGYCRTPGTRRWLSSGTIIGLLFYLATYPLWWMVLKAPMQGAQNFLYAAMEENLSRVAPTARLIKECKERDFLRKDVEDEGLQKKLWEYSERMIQDAEKRGAAERAQAKKENEDRKEEQEAVEELQDYKDKVGKQDKRKEGSRRSRKA